MRGRVFARVALTTALVAGLAVGGAWASGNTVELETRVEPARQDRIVTIGLGAAMVPDYEGSDDYTFAPVPLFKLIDPAGWYVELIGNTLRANVMPRGEWKLGPMARYRAERDDVDNNRVDRMQKVDAAFELGGFVGFDRDNWTAKLEIVQDVADSHDGALVGLTVGYTFPMDPARLTVSGFTTYASEDYMKTYFGVSAADHARSGLKQYDADDGFKDLGATVVAMYSINQNWGVTGALRYTRLIGDAADSPLVEDEGSENQMLASALVSYTF